MAPAHVGSVAVCEQRRVVGIFTERDYVIKIGAAGDRVDYQVKDLMTSNVSVATREQSLGDAAALMLINGFRHLPVVEDVKSRFLVDVISVRDVVRESYAICRDSTFLSTTTVNAVLQHKPKAHLDVLEISPEDTVFEAIRRMATHHVGALVVTSGNQLLGVFTERDFLRKIMVLGREAKTTRVGQVMTPSPAVVQGSQSLQACLDLMIPGGFRHLPVVTGERRVVAMVSIRDVLYSLVTGGK